MVRFALVRLLFAGVFLLAGMQAGAQNGIIGAGFGTNDWTTSDCFGTGEGTSRISTLNANATGNQYFRMVRCWSGDYTQYAQPSCTDLAITAESEISSLTNCGSGAYYLNIASTSDNYIFKTPDGAAGTSFIVFHVQGTVNTVTTVASSAGSLVMPGATNTITATVSGGATLPTGQGVYVRYTTDAWATSTISEMTYSGSGGNYNYTIGAGVHTSGTTVEYYVLTSGDGLTIAHANADWYAINVENNSAANYSYVVPSCTQTIATGAWNVAGTWSGGVPAEGSSVCIQHAVSMDDNHTVTDLYIDNGIALSDATHTLTVNGDIGNFGSHTGTGKIYLNGGGAEHALSGGGAYGNLDLDDAQNATIADGGTAGDLTITTGSFTMTGAEALTATGNLDIEGTLVLSTTSGGDIYVGGDWTRGASGTFTPNSRLAAFNGTALQTISVTGGGTETFAYLRCDKATGDLRVDDSPVTDVTVNGAAGDVLQLTRGTIDINGRTLSLTGTGGNILVENGARSIAGGAGSTLVVSGTMNNTNKTVSRSDGSSTLAIGSNVALEVTTGGIDFGSGITTVNGSFELQTLGYVANNSPSYGSSSSLIYNPGGTFSRRIEWNDASLQDVTIKSGTTLDMYTFDAASIRSMAGNLVIESGAALNCGTAPSNRTADIVIGGNLEIAGSLDMQDMDEANIDVGGNVLISGTLDLADVFGGDLKVAGHFTNNGTFNCNDRAVFFDGSANQNIAGTNAVSLDYLFMQNTGPGVTLQRAVTITDTLHLSDGVITTTDANLLTMTSASAMSSTLGGSTDSYVDGPMAKDFAATTLFIFPLGESGTYAPAGVTPTTTSATTYKANYALTDPDGAGYTGSNLAGTIDHVSAIEYWELSRTAGAADCALRLYYGSHSVVDNSPLNNTLLVAHWSSGDSEWKDEGSTTVSGDATSGYVESGTITSFSPFTLASGDANNPLPVALVAFTAAPEDNVVALQWETHSELNNRLFTVERAATADMELVEVIGTLPGAGTTSERQHYELYDLQPINGWNYYRLRQTDEDGTNAWSHVVPVNMRTRINELAITARNSTSGPELQINAPEAGTATLQLFDGVGQVVLNQRISVTSGINTLPLHHLNLLPTSLYVASLQLNGHHVVTKLISQ